MFVIAGARAKARERAREHHGGPGAGHRSAALLERLQTMEAQLERLRAAAKVTDSEAIPAALPIAVAYAKRYS